jgi:hypothetical protein
MISCAVLIPGTSYAFPPGPEPQGQSSESFTKPVGDEQATHGTSVNDGKRQKGRTSFDEQRGRRHIFDKKHTNSGASAVSATRDKQFQDSQERLKSENVMNINHPTSGSHTGRTAKVGSNKNLTVRTALVAALGGQQVRNPRNRSAAPAIVGGPASTARNPGAINGTNINRRHGN